MDKIFIKDFRVKAIIGILDWERQTTQDILINVTVLTSPRSISAPDDISACVDYSDLADRIRILTESAERYTIEALAEDIATLCLLNEKVISVIVRVEKPGALTGASSAGVEIQRPRSR